MAIGIGPGLKSVGQLCSGMWTFLTERARCRNRVELEKVKNQGNAEVINALPPGGEYVERRPDGQVRLIRVPHGSTPLPSVVHLPTVQTYIVEPAVIHAHVVRESRETLPQMEGDSPNERE